ncbi:PAP1-domain-containing protein [Hypomontagnella monticulosa]|nr:PAP1-domain-containing protein [Hypomontagnella monticulosa]
MASAHTQALHNFILTPQQQNLLFRALTSNQPGSGNGNPTNGLSLSPDSLSKSPVQNQNGGTAQDNQNGTPNGGVQESPFLDYDYDLGPDTSFDFDFANDGQAKMIGDLPGTSSKDDEESKASSPDNDSPDKRSHPDDDEDDDIDEGGGKRRESEGKVPKKPGRKPLTNEPSSKRKAQNRAAQRAFRERKEKHLKDLETKVEELEKASTATNNENSQLRSQIEKLTMELNEYKKKLTLLNSPRPATGPSGGHRNSVFGQAAIQNLSDVNFQFEFPKFGILPGPQDTQMNGIKTSYPSTRSSPNSQPSPIEKSKDQATPNSIKRDSSDSKDSSSKSSGSPYDSTFGASVSRTSLDSSHYSVNGANTGSPCSSTANSNMGPSSSCGTSPEPCTQSPLGFKPVDTLTTIGEEQPALTSDSMAQFNNMNNMDFSNLDWLSQQNGGQFDPQLFGDYREPQDNILANATFDDSFFNDAFDVDFSMPYNMAAPSPNAPKKNLIAEIDARKESEDTIVTTSNGKLLTCNNIWEKLQACPRVQSGDLDLDGLCSDLQKKAKCGGSGAVIDEQDFKAVMTKYLSGDNSKCITGA